MSKKANKIAILKADLMLDIFPEDIFLCGITHEKYSIHK